MKKITFLIVLITLFFNVNQVQAQVQVPANWPSTNWTITGAYNSVVGFTHDPTITANFGYDDNASGLGSLFDVIAAVSPEIDLTPATTAVPLPHLEVVVAFDYVFARIGSEVLKLQYLDPGSTVPWKDWAVIANNSYNYDYESCNGLQSYVSPALNIASFSVTQLQHFKYRILYDDDSHSLGFCMSSPRFYSRETPLCIAINSIDTDPDLISFDQAVISWNDQNTVTPQDGWEIEYGNTGFTQGSGTSITTLLNPYTIPSLLPETCYDVYIRALCDSTISSDWVGPYTFCTTFMGPQCGGQFVDSGGVNANYSSGEDITTTINPTNSGEVVTAVFLSFSTESCCDYLRIYDGDSITSPLVGQYQGTNIPPTIEATLANGGSLTFSFHSDNSVSRDGWEANIFCGLPTTCFMTENLAVNDASITITSAEVTWEDNDNTPPPTFGWQIQYGPTGFDPDTEGIFVDAPTNPSIITGLSGSTEYDFYVRAICGAAIGDDDSFWSGPASFITKCDVIPAPYSQNFENDGLTPICWTQGGTSNEDWQFANDVTAPGHIGDEGNVTGQTLSAGYFAWVDDGNPNNLDTQLISPFIDLAGIANPTLGFYYISNHEFFFLNVRFSVDIWNATTSTWTNDVFVSNSNTSGTGWAQEFIDLSAFAGQVVQARFIVDENSASSRDDFAIDDVYFGEMPTCINVNAVTVNSVGSTDVTLTWGDAGNIPVATQWQIEYGPAGFTQGSATGTIVDVDGAVTPLPYTLAGLNSQTDYDIYVRSNCGVNDFSLWAGPVSFTTLCSIITAPYTENFSDNGVIDACWNQNQNFDPWKFENNVDTPGHVGNLGNTNETSTESGGYFAFVDDSAPHSTNNTITSPLIDVSGLTNKALSFYYISDNEGNSNVNFSVDVWDGATWNTGIFASSENTNGWKKIFINLDLLNITGPVQARFVVDENNGNDFYDDLAIDDVTFEEAPACYPIYNLVASNETESTVDLAWDDTLNVVGIDYIVEYGEAGFALGSTDGTQVTAATNPFTVINLDADTDYEFYVRAACTTVDLGAWTNMAQATTLPTCIPVSNIAPSNITTTSFDLTWVDNNVDVPLGGWDVEYVISTFPQGSGTTQTVATELATITGLLPSSFYDVFVRANCEADDSDPSRWVGPITIQTNIAPPLNDACVDAIELNVSVDCEPILGNNILATQTTPALETDCNDPAVDGLEPGFVLDDVWYKFTMPATGTVIIQTAFAGGMEDGAVSVYTGTCGNLVKAVNANGRDVCSDDADADLSAGTNDDDNNFGIVQLVNQVPGTEFYVRVWSVDQNNLGAGNIHGQFTICVFGQPVNNREQLDLEDENISNSFNLSYYPNPVNTTLKIDTSEPINAISIYSLLGQEVMRFNYDSLENREVNLNLEQLNSGAYFVKVQVGTQTKTIKIIKE